MLTDVDIAVDRAQRGDRDAFRELVEVHARGLHRLAFRITGSDTDADDMVQETFLRAWRQLGKFDGRASFGTWLHRICSNCSLDLLRSRKRSREQAVAGFPETGVEDGMERSASEGPSPERLAVSRQVGEILGRAIDELSDAERVAFVLRHYEGVGIEEIARTMGVQPGAAKHSVFRAVAKLRLALEGVAR